ncbi:MAG: entericidin A/B family lipoprotein [Candidatus Hydrogenedentes bacterium]|nr:entericidin A/B family lipoprotein [Candidatus Hydrogenedentota bacterium]
MKHIKTLLVAALFAAIALGALACNTVRGVGKDVQAGGSAIEKAAKK